MASKDSHKERLIDQDSSDSEDTRQLMQGYKQE